MFHQLIQTWFTWVQDWGYSGVVLLMAMESSIFPVPSEIVIPPAAILAAQGKMSFWGVVLAGTIGSWLGAVVTYWVSWWLEHLIVRKWGRFIGLTEEKLTRAEHFVERYEAPGIFFARLLPVVRHVISIPAGFLEMPFGMFSLMTIAGSAVWCTVLAWFGYQMAEGAGDLKDPDVFLTALKHKSHLIAIGVIVIGALYFVMLRLTKKKVER
jgi:membrane protein DedA with SNARE-associated domain